MSELFFPGDAEKELPPLRIHHFLVWMAVATVLLSVERLTADFEGSIGQASVSFSALASVWESLTICCLGFGYYWYRKGKEFLELPGHGILVTYGLYYACEFVANSILVLLDLAIVQKTHAFWTYDSIAMILGFAFLPVLAFNFYLNVLFARRFSSFGRWRKFYIVSNVVIVLQIVLPMTVVFLFVFSGMFGSSFIFVFAMLPQIALGLYLVWIAITDLREGYRFHWSHYAGVVVVIGATFSSILGTMWMLLFQDPELYAGTMLFDLIS